MCMTLSDLKTMGLSVASHDIGTVPGVQRSSSADSAWTCSCIRPRP